MHCIIIFALPSTVSQKDHRVYKQTMTFCSHLLDFDTLLLYYVLSPTYQVEKIELKLKVSLAGKVIVDAVCAYVKQDGGLERREEQATCERWPTSKTSFSEMK